MRPLLILPVVALVIATGCGDEPDTSPAGDERSPAVRYEADLTVLESPEHGPELCHQVADSLPPQCGGPPIAAWDWSQVDGEESRNGTTWGTFHVVGTYDGGRFTATEPATTPDPAVDDDPGQDFSPGCTTPEVVDPTQGGAEWEAMSQDFGPFEIPDLVTAWVSDPAGDWDGPFTGTVIVQTGSADAARAVVRAHYGGPLCIVERDGPTEAELQRVQDELTDAAATEALGSQGAWSDGRRGVVVAEVWVADTEALAYAQDRWGDLVELDGILDPVP